MNRWVTSITMASVTVAAYAAQGANAHDTAEKKDPTVHHDTHQPVASSHVHASVTDAHAEKQSGNHDTHNASPGNTSVENHAAPVEHHAASHGHAHSVKKGDAPDDKKTDDASHRDAHKSAKVTPTHSDVPDTHMKGERVKSGQSLVHKMPTDQEVEHQATTNVHHKSEPTHADSHQNVSHKPVPAQAQAAHDQLTQHETKHDSGIDNVHLEDGGNWLLKRVWWEKAEAEYEKVKQEFAGVMEARMKFFSQRNDVDRDLDVFYSHIGFDRGELEQIVDYLIERLEKDVSMDESLTVQERELIQKLVHKKRELEQIKLDVKSIRELEENLDETIATLMQQVNVASEYEKKSWANFKSIARELSDIKAKDMFYDIEGRLASITKIKTYITGKLSHHFNDSLNTLHDQMRRITGEIKVLHGANLDLKKEAEKLSKKIVHEDTAERELRAHETPVDRHEAAQDSKKGTSWFDVIKHVCVSAYHAFVGAFYPAVHKVHSFLTGVAGWFSSSKKQIVAAIKTGEQRVEADAHKGESDIERQVDRVRGDGGAVHQDVAVQSHASHDIQDHTVQGAVHNGGIARTEGVHHHAHGAEQSGDHAGHKHTAHAPRSVHDHNQHHSGKHDHEPSNSAGHGKNVKNAHGHTTPSVH